VRRIAHSQAQALAAAAANGTAAAANGTGNRNGTSYRERDTQTPTAESESRFIGDFYLYSVEILLQQRQQQQQQSCSNDQHIFASSSSSSSSSSPSAPSSTSSILPQTCFYLDNFIFGTSVESHEENENMSGEEEKEGEELVLDMEMLLLSDETLSGSERGSSAAAADLNLVHDFIGSFRELYRLEMV
jgi:hypothetical protein